MAWQSIMSFPAEGQSVTLFVYDMGRRGGSDDGGNQRPDGEKNVMHDEGELLSNNPRGTWRLFMHKFLGMQEEEM